MEASCGRPRVSQKPKSRVFVREKTPQVSLTCVQVKPDTIVQVWMGDAADVERITSQGLRVIYSTCWYLDYISYGMDWDKYYKCEQISECLDCPAVVVPRSAWKFANAMGIDEAVTNSPSPRLHKGVWIHLVFFLLTRQSEC